MSIEVEKNGTSLEVAFFFLKKKRLSRWTRQSEIEKLKIYIGYMKCIESQLKTELNGSMDGWSDVKGKFSQLLGGILELRFSRSRMWRLRT